MASTSAREIAEQIRHPDRADGEGSPAPCSDGTAGIDAGHARRLHAEQAPVSISVADVIQAIDGPFTVTACSTERHDCDQYSKCNVRGPLWQIRERIVATLGMVRIAEMAADSDPRPQRRRSSPSCAGAGYQQARAMALDRDDDEASDLLDYHATRRPIRAWSRRCCRTSPSSSATPRAAITRSAGKPRRRWRTRASRSPI